MAKDEGRVRPSTLTDFTLVDDGLVARVRAAIIGGQVWLSPDTVREALGWELKPEGLCRGDICVPPPPGLSVGPEGVDLGELAATLRRPLALDLDERAAYLAVAASDRSAALATLEAPDFTLPDLDGRLHTLSAHRGKKVLLVAFASW